MNYDEWLLSGPGGPLDDGPDADPCGCGKCEACIQADAEFAEWLRTAEGPAADAARLMRGMVREAV